MPKTSGRARSKTESYTPLASAHALLQTDESKIASLVHCNPVLQPRPDANATFRAHPRINSSALEDMMKRVLKICWAAMLLMTAIVRAAAPASQPAVDLSSAILTPPSPKTPRINGAAIYGERPSRPFLYTVPVTGDRPMTFSAKGLPAGLELDAGTGRITGSVATAGTYAVVLHAANSLGSAEKNFKIVIGDQIALTPPMGWNSWNCWAGAVDQEKVLQSARAMVSSGLIDHGWTYINIDDTWQGKRDPVTHALQPDLKKFPDMKGLCEQIHQMGLKAGIYSTPWVISYGGRLGGSAENPNGDPQVWPGKLVRNRKILPCAVGKYSFADVDARQWAAWGMDYLKYDWNPIEIPQVQEMSDDLKNSGRDMVFSLSNQAPFKLAGDYATLANCWRTTNDIRDTWGTLQRNGFVQDKWAAFNGPGHYNDPDMLVVGYVGWGPKLHSTHLTADEQYTHISLWSLLSAPLLIGCDLDRLDPFTLNLLTNDEVLAIDQDALAKQAARVPVAEHTFLYVKELADGNKAVGLFNTGPQAETVTAKWADVGVTGPQAVRDLWRQKDLGILSDQFETQVPSHGVMLIKIGSSR
jgi:alpha-galactosidase